VPGQAAPLAGMREDQRLRVHRAIPCLQSSLEQRFRYVRGSRSAGQRRCTDRVRTWRSAPGSHSLAPLLAPRLHSDRLRRTPVKMTPGRRVMWTIGPSRQLVSQTRDSSDTRGAQPRRTSSSSPVRSGALPVRGCRRGPRFENPGHHLRHLPRCVVAIRGGPCDERRGRDKEDRSSRAGEPPSANGSHERPAGDRCWPDRWSSGHRSSSPCPREHPHSPWLSRNRLRTLRNGLQPRDFHRRHPRRQEVLNCPGDLPRLHPARMPDPL
jgi:hypothetical protein